jgi:lactoylglutathione lyase
MTFNHITVPVKDLDKSLAFYQGLLGLELQRRSPAWDRRELAFLGVAGQPQIELISGEAAAYSGFSIGFVVESLESATEKMEKSGYPRIRGPLSPNPTVAFSFFHDPDGVEIQLLEHKHG